MMTISIPHQLLSHMRLASSNAIIQELNSEEEAFDLVR